MVIIKNKETISEKLRSIEERIKKEHPAWAKLYTFKAFKEILGTGFHPSNMSDLVNNIIEPAIESDIATFYNNVASAYIRKCAVHELKELTTNEGRTLLFYLRKDLKLPDEKAVLTNNYIESRKILNNLDIDKNKLYPLDENKYEKLNVIT